MISIPAHIHLKDLPEILPRFFAIASYSSWKKRYDQLQQEIRRFPPGEPSIRHRHSVVLELVALEERRRKTRRYPRKVENPSLGAALAFAVTSYRVYRHLSAPARKRMAGMMRDGLQTDRGLQPLAFEMGSAVDLSSRGFKLQFVDLESRERFDYLIAKDGVEAEFECKTVSYDLGRQVHRRVFECLGKQIFERGVSEFLTTSGPNIRVDLTLETRLPSGEKPLARVVDLVASALRGDAATEPGLGCAKASEWDIPDRPGDLRQTDLKGTLDPGDDEHTLIAIGPRRAFALVASSEKPAKLLQGVFRELKRVAREQLSGTRPGVIAVQIEDIRESDWVQLSHGSAIEAMSAAYFVTGSREHIHSVLYSSEQLLHKAPGQSWLSGTRLVYQNPANPEAANPVLDFTLGE